MFPQLFICLLNSKFQKKKNRTLVSSLVRYREKHSIHNKRSSQINILGRSIVPKKGQKVVVTDLFRCIYAMCFYKRRKFLLLCYIQHQNEAKHQYQCDSTYSSKALLVYKMQYCAGSFFNVRLERQSQVQEKQLNCILQ